MILPFTLVVASSVALIVAERPSSDPVQVEYGHRVAQRYCGECHAVDPGKASRFDPAPDFPHLYESYPIERLAKDLPGHMTESHPHMSDMSLGPDEMTAITAYLASFRPRRATLRDTP